VAEPRGEDAGPARPARRKRRRLSRSGEFDRVYREGRSHAGRHLILYAFPRAKGDEGPRLGISVGRRVGGAVERNRVKRALRDSFWACAEPLPDTHDFVIVARPAAAKLAAEEGEPGLREALRELMDEAGLTGEAAE
jgi:ribonuclease P protein component